VKESYSLPELARAWSVHVDTIRRMIRRGQLQAFKAGGVWRIKAEEKDKHENNLANLCKSMQTSK